MSQTYSKLILYRSEASPTEIQVIDYVMQHAPDVSKMSIHQLSEQTFASPTSIIRLCKKLGFSGYKEFVRQLIVDQASRKHRVDESVYLTQTQTSNEFFHGIIDHNIQSLLELQRQIDPTLIEACVRAIDRADKIVFFGMGASLLVGKDAQMKFVRIDKLVHVNDDWHTQLLMARNLSKKDLAFAISYSGETQEVLECSKEAKKLGATIITMTCNKANSLSKLADIPLFVPQTEHGLRTGAMASRIAQLTLIDVIYSQFLQLSYDDRLLLLERTRIMKGVNESDKT
ncbi:TPA: MurR/RpiR family transcriptional regulator [Streptococcus suis]